MGVLFALFYCNVQTKKKNAPNVKGFLLHPDELGLFFLFPDETHATFHGVTGLQTSRRTFKLVPDEA